MFDEGDSRSSDVSANQGLASAGSDDVSGERVQRGQFAFCDLLPE
jgi:hypothetical protein